MPENSLARLSLRYLSPSPRGLVARTPSEREAAAFARVEAAATVAGYDNGLDGFDPTGHDTFTEADANEAEMPDERIVAAYRAAWKRGRADAARHGLEPTPRITLPE